MKRSGFAAAGAEGSLSGRGSYGTTFLTARTWCSTGMLAGQHGHPQYPPDTTGEKKKKTPQTCKGDVPAGFNAIGCSRQNPVHTLCIPPPYKFEDGGVPLIRNVPARKGLETGPVSDWLLRFARDSAIGWAAGWRVGYQSLIASDVATSSIKNCTAHVPGTVECSGLADQRGQVCVCALCVAGESARGDAGPDPDVRRPRGRRGVGRQLPAVICLRRGHISPSPTSLNRSSHSVIRPAPRPKIPPPICPSPCRLGIGKFREFGDLQAILHGIVYTRALELCVHWLLPQRVASVIPRLAPFCREPIPRFRGRVSEEIWTALNIEVLTPDVGEASAGMQGRVKREIPEKTRQLPASPGTIPTCKNSGAIPPAIEPGSPWWGGGE
ncbi:hypothetical protein PR048_022233 [Dryococelus australis]|uniref:Uncharacterized protein n=1 Tax=Dryococelus australis TaxID=614101 RepID=A0ABQ9H0K2_9NEOP|nr:hypothetical protein PR048_022233 [Dryococelus australis]